MTYQIPSTIHAHMGCTRTQDGDDMSERDIVERLRQAHRDFLELAALTGASRSPTVMLDAAAEIERLRTERAGLRQELTRMSARCPAECDMRAIVEIFGNPSEPTPDLTHRPGRAI